MKKAIDITKIPEQWKIVEVIEKWGYLCCDEIALLLNKKEKLIKSTMSILTNKELVKAHTLTKKYYYTPTQQALKIIGRKNNLQIKVNYSEIPHQDICVKFLASVLDDVKNYKTERELKIEDPDRIKFNDLELELKNGSKVIVEVERTQKSYKRYDEIFFKLMYFLNKNYEIWWVVNSEKMQKIITNIINKENFKLDQQKVILFK